MTGKRLFKKWRSNLACLLQNRILKAGPMVGKCGLISEKNLILRSDEDFWCIGKSIEKAELNQIDPVLFITHTIQQLQPLYDRCHQ
ncbi:HI_0552 family protein [Haemophilus influenzae]|uniref:HI_0552 family protein n=1 Tax=Haemophilus influenzae TaxID=727 RepID=UPI003C12C7F3